MPRKSAVWRKSRVDEFEEIMRASLTSKSICQRKTWWQPKETALSVFVDNPSHHVIDARRCSVAVVLARLVVSGEVHGDRRSSSARHGTHFQGAVRGAAPA